MAHGQHQQLCTDFAEDAQRLVEEFKQKLTQLVGRYSGAQVLENHTTPQEDEANHVNINGNDQRSRTPCPQCDVSFGRSNNLRRHWSKHVPCAERCMFCDLEISDVHKFVSHHKKCTEKTRFGPDSVERASMLQRLRNLKGMANRKFEEQVAPLKKAKKRHRRQSSKAVKGNVLHGLQDEEWIAPSVPILEVAISPGQSGLQGEGKITDALPHTYKTLEANSERPTLGSWCANSQSVDLSRPDLPAFAASYMIDQSGDQSRPNLPAFAASYTIDQPGDPGRPDLPAFAASYTIDQSGDPGRPDLPSFAASYMIHQSSNQSRPDLPAFAASYTIDQSGDSGRSSYTTEQPVDGSQPGPQGFALPY